MSSKKKLTDYLKILPEICTFVAKYALIGRLFDFYNLLSCCVL